MKSWDKNALTEEQFVPVASGRPATILRNIAAERFVKGPIPLPWLHSAAKLPGKALHVAVALWYQAGLEKRARVKLSQKQLREFGVLKDALCRALKSLELAGLISVTRKRGCSPDVTILQATGAGSNSERISRIEVRHEP